MTRLICGPSAGTYLRLAGGFTAKGANIGQEGVKQIGTFEGIPVFKAPASIIPTDEMLTVYKNVNNESDIGIAFGTLIPFFSTGMKLYELYPFAVMRLTNLLNFFKISKENRRNEAFTYVKERSTTIEKQRNLN